MKIFSSTGSGGSGDAGSDAVQSELRTESTVDSREVRATSSCSIALAIEMLKGRENYAS